MLTYRRYRNVLDEHHLIMRVTGQRYDMFARIRPHSLGQLSIKIRNALRCFFKAVAIGVLAHALEHHPHTRGDLFEIDLSFYNFTQFYYSLDLSAF